MNSWLMWDSTTPWLIPRGVPVVAPYRNGEFAWSPLALDDAGSAARAFIDVLGTDPGGCAVLDVESGDARPGDVPGWLDRKAAIDGGPGSGCVYCNRATLPAVIDAADGRPFFLWLATLDGTIPTVAQLLDYKPPSATLCAVQAWGAAQLGFNADLSVVVSADWLTRIGGTP